MVLLPRNVNRIQALPFLSTLPLGLSWCPITAGQSAMPASSTAHVICTVLQFPLLSEADIFAGKLDIDA
jgi:hypothetical protein